MNPARQPVHLSIVGGGASGVLTAVNVLARSDDPGLRVTIHEASGIVGRGVAYGTNDQRHLLNVRTRHMSAFPDAPSDLLDWATRTGRSPSPQGFLPRADYAIYLQDRLADVADHRLRVQAGRVHDLEALDGADGTDGTDGTDSSDAGQGDDARSRFVLHSGEPGAATATPATHVVLAHGNSAPRPLSTADGVALPEAPWHLGNPWDLGRLRMLPADAVVVVVGTGLTAVDTAITLLEEGPGRRVVMVSRSGELPRAHVEQHSTAWVTRVPKGQVTADLLAANLAEQIEAARHQGVGWRAVVDGLRPATQGLWRRLPEAERRRFIERYGREWEVRRHRMAPGVAARLAEYRDAGRLEVRVGTTSAVRDLGETCAVDVDGQGSPVLAHAVVNCTGPLTDVTLSDDPLLRSLHGRGLVTADPLALGLATTLGGAVIGADGAVVPGLLAVGPSRKGTLWESTAIPEIRTQAAEVAAAVLGGVPGAPRLAPCPSRAVTVG